MVSPIKKLAKRVESKKEDKDILFQVLISAGRAAEANAAIAKERLQPILNYKRRGNSSRRVLSKSRVIGWKELDMDRNIR
jgi:hypothetical protein